MFGSSNVGRIRTDNQDSYMLDTMENGVGFAVVCDGMGGVNGGKTASLTAVNCFSSFMSEIDPQMTPGQLNDIFDKAIRKANEEILRKSISDVDLTGMGTTLVAAVIVNETAYIMNIGDSRCYIINDGSIVLVTKDHSAVQELVDKGILTESQARNHPNKNIITRALGVEPNVQYDLFTHQLSEDDMILLCSDGITNYIDDLELPFEVLKGTETVPQRLIELANSRGGSDNSTVVIIKI